MNSPSISGPSPKRFRTAGVSSALIPSQPNLHPGYMNAPLPPHHFGPDIGHHCKCDIRYVILNVVVYAQ